jgi:Carboxypeptidase regulatory-like domain/TonB dependent receptor
MKCSRRSLIVALCLFAISQVSQAQTVTATLQGQVTDPSGAAISGAKVTAKNKATDFTRTADTTSGAYNLEAMPAGDYSISVQASGFATQEEEITLQVGQTATLNFNLAVGQASERVLVQATSEVTEPTRTQISDVITQQQIRDLPVNGREFIDFALLSPGVQIGDTTSGSTDVIVEPVTKLSFDGQNIHYNFIAVDGADDISTASGIQRGTPPQDSVEEFRVINTDYTSEFGRATAGIVNIITKSGSNNLHGSAYEYFRNNALDADSSLAAPGFTTLRQNQFGAVLGGPITKDKVFFFANYEGQRHDESPIYNSIVLANIAAINQVKTTVFGLPPENLGVLRTNNLDDGFARMDANLSSRNYLYARYFVTDGRLTNQSPLNNGFDLPSAFKNNYILDQSVAGALDTTISSSWLNDLRMQYAHRTFDFPVVSTQPHLEVANTFAVGVNRGNPDIYREGRIELVDNVTHTMANHTLSFGGNFDWVRTYESFPLFYPFEADFANLAAFLGTDGAAAGSPGCVGTVCPDPFVIFFQRFNAATNPPFTEGTLLGGTAVYQGGAISQAVRDQSAATLDHTYDGFYIQDRWRATSRLTLNAGLRWEFETWPSNVLNTNWKDFDPRLGLAFRVGTSRNVVLRTGFGLFHGTIASPLLMCQAPSCGGLSQYPGRPFEDTLNANTGLFSFASSPFIDNVALNALLKRAQYPNGDVTDGVALGCPGGTLAGCGFLQDATIVRFDQNYQNPYAIQASISLEFQPFKDSSLEISGMHLRGVHLGSFYNVNQPDPSDTVAVYDSGGNKICKDVYFNFAASGFATPPAPCSPYPAAFAIPNTPHINAIPGFRDPQYSVFFEAASKWDSVYDALLLHFDKRLSHNVSYEISYTYSHSIDDGPNPSFVLIPQDSNNGSFRSERADSADDIPQRFVGSATFSSPERWNAALRDFAFSFIVTLQSPQFFTKYAGFDANGDVFGNNDRVGGEPRDTFRGDSLQTIDVRLARSFRVREAAKLDLMAEAYNLANRVNVRYFNTNYGAADFCKPDPTAPGCLGATQFYLEGSPNPFYGTPSSVFNPRQIQLVVRLSF